MKVIYLIAAGVTVLLSLGSCNRTCENVKVGDVEFSSEVTNFLVYDQDEQVVFSNADGDEITFRANIQENVYFICQKITCSPADPYKSDFCEYIESPIVEMFLLSDSTLLGVTASIAAYEPESDLLYDPIGFTLSHVNDGINASHITGARFTDPPFRKSDIDDIDNYVTYFTRVDLRNEELNDVYVFEQDNLAFYFKEYDGFLAFRIDDEIWFKN